MDLELRLHGMISITLPSIQLRWILAAGPIAVKPMVFNTIGVATSIAAPVAPRTVATPGNSTNTPLAAAGAISPVASGLCVAKQIQNPSSERYE